MNGAYSNWTTSALSPFYYDQLEYFKSNGNSCVYLPNEKAKSRLDRNEVVETDIGWLNLP
jgi:hypothetical protein